ERRHAAVGADREEALDAIKGNWFGCRGPGVCCAHRQRRHQREADDEHTAGLQKFAARDEWGVHALLPAARLIARTMRTWVPQRHRFAASACLISLSLGCGF